MCVIDFISVKLLKNKIALLYHALALILLSCSPQQISHLLFIRDLSPVRMQTHPVGHIFSISSIPWISCPSPCLPSKALRHSKIRVQLSTALTCGLLTDAGIKTPQTEDTSHPRSPDSAGPSVQPATPCPLPGPTSHLLSHFRPAPRPFNHQPSCSFSPDPTALVLLCGPPVKSSSHGHK